MNNNKSENYQICSRTVMDTSDPNIIFDEEGVSNHVSLYNKAKDIYLVPENEKEQKLIELVNKIKKDGVGKEYDCVIGLSGGVDSSFVAYQVKKLGLRPLAVHLDNGWNSELAVKNIENIVTKLKFDLYTLVIDWEEFKDLQLAFLKASVVDIEMLTDNAIVVLLNKIAKEKKIKYFLIGTNVTTESIMPKTWFYNIKYDSLNIMSIHKRFGRLKKLKSYPYLNFLQYVRYRYFNPIENISLLNYFDYNKSEAIKILQKELNWQDYGGKHCESKFTQFYQSYILPKKFNIDKRRAFLSCLILSEQITRDQALEELKTEIYDKQKLKEDIDYVVKKFNISNDELENILTSPIKSHYDYPSYDGLHIKIVKFLRKYRII